MIRKTLLVISLLLLTGTVGLWVRSYWVSDYLTTGTTARWWSIVSVSGGIGVEYHPTSLAKTSFVVWNRSPALRGVGGRWYRFYAGFNPPGLNPPNY